MPDHIAQRYPKARKVHVCDFCGGRIEPGETYGLTVYVDGGLYTWKAHDLCDQLFTEFCDDPIDAGEIWEALRNVDLADVTNVAWGGQDNNKRAAEMWHEANED